MYNMWACLPTFYFHVWYNIFFYVLVSEDFNDQNGVTYAVVFTKQRKDKGLFYFFLVVKFCLHYCVPLTKQHVSHCSLCWEWQLRCCYHKKRETCWTAGLKYFYFLSVCHTSCFLLDTADTADNLSLKRNQSAKPQTERGRVNLDAFCLSVNIISSFKFICLTVSCLLLVSPLQVRMRFHLNQFTLLWP